MDLHSKQESELLKEFTKCGYIYKSSAIGDKHQLLLSCLHCNEVFSQLENFLEHSVKHLDVLDFCIDAVEEDSLDIETAIIKTEEIECPSETLMPDVPALKQEDNNKRVYYDTLEQEGNGDFERLPEIVKTENIEEIERPANSDGHLGRENKSIEGDNSTAIEFEMGKTCAKRRREASMRYLGKIKRDPLKYKEYCDKAAERMRKRREEISKLAKTNSKLLKEKREKDRIRQKRLRDRKKHNGEAKEKFEPYTRRQKLRKAVKKTEIHYQ